MKVGFLSDAHGNVEAFDLAVARLREQGADRIFFLGDAVGYLPGHAVVEALSGGAIAAQKGNHDAMLLGGVAHEREAIYRLAETRAAMPTHLLDDMKSWPDQRRIRIGRREAHLVHGSPADVLYAYVYPDSDLTSLPAPVDGFVVCANTHRPFVRQTERAVFVNIGSCGLPRDFGGLGAACLIDEDTNEVDIIRFDIHAATQAALARCGPVHPSVRSVMERPGDGPLMGRLVDG